jgi:hypothetical protein
MLACSVAVAQTAAPISLQEQLNAQYKLAKVGRATGEWAVVEPGTVLQIEKGGIAGVPPKSVALCPAKFEGGNLKGPSGMCTAMLGAQNIRYLTVGEKVYPAKMDVNIGKDKITFAIFECDSCNGVTSSYRSEVIFQFPRGYLATANPAQVEDTIGLVFSVSNSEPPQNQKAQNQDEPAQPPDQSQPEPQTIHLGQTTDQVVSALGKPEKIVDLGAKQIYVYKDLKITLVNGKVSDVQ